MYQYIKIQPVTSELDNVINPQSNYSKGVARESALAHSAPDLLAALEAMFDATGHLRVSSTGDPICKQARAAIAKAKGQQ